MSVEIDTAINSKLTGDSTLVALATGGIHRSLATEGSVPPYVLFYQLGDGVTAESLGDAELWTSFQYVVKAVCVGGSDAAATTINARLVTLLNDSSTLSPSSGRVMKCRLARRISQQDPATGDPLVWNVGGQYDIWWAPT